MKRIVKHLDKPLLIISILLFAVGLIMVFSASNVTAYMSHAVSPYNYFLKQALFLIVGLLASFFIIFFPTKTYFKISTWLLFIGILSLILLPAFGIEVNNAKSWYAIGPFSIQPSEFIKVITIVWLSCYYELNIKKLDKYIPSLFPLAIAAICAISMFLQPDLGTTIIYIVIVFSVFWVSTVKKELKYKTVFGVIGFAICAAIILFSSGKTLLLDRQLERITEYRNPCDKLLSSGNQVCNSYIAINNGGLTGAGLGNSTQKYLYLPEPYTDFIFAIIVEELGLITGIGIIISYVFILYRILKIGRESPNSKDAMICFGIAIYIFIHIAINLLGLFGLMPMTGVPLPFMSYGGSFTICLIVALTIVQRISIENGISKSKYQKKS